MSEVARHAGVSRMTVSNVINHPDIVTAATRERVLASMRELRYRNNLVARSLRLTQPRQIGYVLPQLPLSNPYMDQFLHDLANVSRRQGRTLALVSEATPEAEMEAGEELYYGKVIAGLVISNITAQDPRPGMLVSLGVPFAAYGRSDAAGTVPWSWVDTDAAVGLDLAVAHLTSLGHRSLALLGASETDIAQLSRARGYVAACTRHGLGTSTTPARIVHTATDIPAGVAAARRLLTGDAPPTALVCLSDGLAAGALMAIRDLGLRPGTDVAVTGYDDSPLTAFGEVGITSVRQPSAELAEELVRLVTQPPPEPQHVLLNPTLAVRSSTVAP